MHGRFYTNDTLLYSCYDALWTPLQGVLELTLKCSKKRYDGYLRMWKRKLYEYAGLQRLDFQGFPPLPEGAEASLTSPDTVAAPATPLDMAAAPEAAAASSAAPYSAAAGGGGSVRSSSRKQSNPSRLSVASAPVPQGSWAKKLTGI